MSLLNRMGCVVTWVTRVSGLRGPNFYVDCMSYVGQNFFYVGQYFMWVIIFTWVGWVNFFTWFKIFCVSQNFLRGLNFGVSLFFFFGGGGGGGGV